MQVPSRISQIFAEKFGKSDNPFFCASSVLLRFAKLNKNLHVDPRHQADERGPQESRSAAEG